MTDSGVVYEDRLPLTWRWAELPSTRREREHQDESNLAVMNVVLSLGEKSVIDGGEESAPWMQEMARIESKLDLVLALLGDVLARDQNLPVPMPIPVCLTGSGITWCTDNSLQVDDPVELTLYLLPGVPRPVILHGIVQEVEPEATGYRIQAAFTDMQPLFQDNLDKLVFRWHRRHIAEVRRGHSHS